MARFEKGNKLGNRFSKDNQPRKNGRKPDLYKIAGESYNVSKSEWFRTKKYISQCPRWRIDEIVDDKETPMWVCILGRGLIRAAAKGDTRVLEEIEDRLFGKTTLSIESDITTNGKDIGPRIVFSPTPLTEKDIREIKDIQNGKKGPDDTGIPETD